ncbi:MAG TPA: SPASM domain-containing protein, partial [Syntrophales bacterium]|nr:SPASM domain-containing protein [Syntrophales bacterium]
EDALRGLSVLRENNINTQLIMTLYNDNVGEIERLLDLASKMKVSSIKINPIMPTGRGKKLFENCENIEFSDLIKIDRWIEEDLVSKYDLDIHFDIPIGLKSLKRIKSRQLFECNILNIIGVLSDGTISICGIGQTEAALNMGNIAVDDLREIWANSPILRRLRKDIPRNLEGICGRCIFKFRCRGACRACAYSMTGDFKSPFFVCEKAHEKGLFLESRMIN